MPVIQNNISPKKIIVSWFPAIGFAALIFYLSSIPGKNMPQLFPHQDTLFHIIEYALFTMLITRAFKACCPKISFIRIFFWVFFLSFSFALSDEFHQAFVPGRFPSLYDVASDSIGILIGGTFYRWLK
ncbi:MAG: VanZ family protein [Candidatus Omnitrophica bacterium]|nr:VanZ family protein [Candidatus Omnitrophota bacterium]